MNGSGIPCNDCSPNYLSNELGGSVAITTYPQILENPEWCIGRCANESHCGDTNEQPFLHPLRHVIQIWCLVHILTPPLVRTIFLVPHEYHLSEDVLGHLL
jgi:hypothetical protein